MQLPRPTLACNAALPDADAIAFEFGLRHPIRVDQDPDLVRPRPTRPTPPIIRDEPPQFPWPWIILVIIFAALAIYGISQS